MNRFATAAMIVFSQLRIPSRSVLVISILGAMISCVGFEAGHLERYDQRPVTIQTLSLFNQRIPSRLSSQTWKGDWIFRRERLELIDRGLRDIKPDILILQQSLSKKESPSDSDRNILLAGALKDYDWHFRVVAEYDDTQEVETLAVAVGNPLKIDRIRTLSRRELWNIGRQGFVTTTSVVVDGQVITIFNVQIPILTDSRDLWYLFLKDKILELIEKESLCSQRIVVAGYIPGGEGSSLYNAFLQDLGLKDASIGFCEVVSRCQTSTPLNQIFMATVGDERPSRADRILVHKSAQILSSAVNFTTSTSVYPETSRAHIFGLSSVWPSQRFGWVSSVRFGRCLTP